MAVLFFVVFFIAAHGYHGFNVGTIIKKISFFKTIIVNFPNIIRINSSSQNKIDV